jgi:tRNA/tmRNA/rRNA uracil-C5-methylase (TrmA/RlmC/RlmD family)
VSVARGERVELCPTRISAEGVGIARVGEVWVHTPGLFVGERGLVEIEHVSRHHPRAHARLRELDPAASGRRRAAPCRHHGVCTGCPLMQLDGATQREHKLMSLRAAQGWSIARFEPGEERELGYRCSSKRVVFGRVGAVSLGSFARGSHRAVDMVDCQVDHPAIVAAARELVEVASAESIVPYDERSGAGDLRYVWFKTDGDAVLVTLITGGEESRAAARLPSRLTRAAGVAWSVQPVRANAVRGRAATWLRGARSLSLRLADVPLEVGPLGFLQPNPRVASRAYQALVRGPGGGARTGARAFDLYAGAGVTTTLLRGAFDEVLPCEAYPESARELGVAPERVDLFLERHVLRIMLGRGPAARRPELVIANPPRGGMGAAACRWLVALAAREVHIMSCSAEALAADLARLSGPGGYRVVRVAAYDTLPQTAHVELVAWLSR